MGWRCCEVRFKGFNEWGNECGIHAETNGEAPGSIARGRQAARTERV
jgi:hypothetical protein